MATSKDTTTTRPQPTRKPTRGEYIETDTGNKVSRRALITGTAHITLAGRVVVSPGAVLRGDLISPASASTATTTTSTSSSASASAPLSATASAPAATRTSIAISRYTFIGPHSVIHPPHRLIKGTPQYLQLRIGENVYIAAHCHIAAAQIGSHVFIGEGAVVGDLCVLRDGCKVLEGSVLPEGMVVPAGVVVGGVPARVLGDVPDAYGVGGGGGVPGEPLWVEGGELRELIRSIR